MKTKNLMGILVMIFIFTSCSKPKDIAIEYDGADNIDFDYENFENFLDAMPEGSNIVFDRIIVDDFYSHMYQKTRGIDCGRSACLPTSYMIARKIVFPDSEFSVSEVNNLSEEFGMPSDCSGGVAIDEAAQKAADEFGSCSFGKVRTDNRTYTKDLIQAWLNEGRPLIARIVVKKSSIVDYYKKNETYNHFVVIVGLTLTNVGTGSIIYYSDPLSKTNTPKPAKYSDFLNSMKACNGYYYLLPIGCQTLIY